MKIILFRHGEKQITDAPTDKNVCLTSKGIVQIETLAHNLHQHFPGLIGMPYIYASPYPRTIQSAEIVRRTLTIGEIQIMPHVKEIFAHADHAISKDTKKEMHRHALHHLDYINQSGYSYGQKAQQAMDFFTQFYALDTPYILIAAHGGIIRSIVLTITHKKHTDGFLENAMPEGSYVVIQFDGTVFTLETDEYQIPH